METPSNLPKNSRAAFSVGFLLTRGESLTFRSGVTVSTDHGTMWLAVSSCAIGNLVMQHRASYEARTAARKKT
jgi:hypothetical protein